MTLKREITKRKKNDENGFTLLEVLISVAILSVGLLGIAVMQDASIQGTMVGSRMSVGTNLADEMMERVRLKMPGVSVAGFNVSDYNGIDTSNTATRPPASAWQARGDYDQWAARIQQYLPGGVGTVTVTQPVSNPLNRNDVTVRITWPGATRNFTVTMMTSILS
ncbi:MAG: type IV pilus modification protein PilV [Nitrospiria bacterium]